MLVFLCVVVCSSYITDTPEEEEQADDSEFDSENSATSDQSGKAISFFAIARSRPRACVRHDSRNQNMSYQAKGCPRVVSRF